jgi:hypothetical protein
MTHSMRSLLGIAAAGAAALLLGSSFATAVLADGLPGCPVPYLVQDANAFPATLAVDQKGNQDGIVCVLLLATPDTAQVGFVIVDNNVR